MPTIKINNKEFVSLRQACIHFGVPYKTVHMRIKRGWLLEKALVPGEFNKKSINILDREFSSITDACKYYGVHINLYKQRLSYGWSIEESLGIIEKDILVCKGKLYIIRNTINDKVYIGITSMPIKTRFAAHIQKSNERKTRLQKAICRLGADKFSIEVLKTSTNRVKLCEAEVRYIKRFDSINKGYNQRLGGGSLCGKTGHQIEYEGKLYRSKKHLAEKLNINIDTLRYRIKNSLPLQKVA